MNPLHSHTQLNVQEPGETESGAGKNTSQALYATMKQFNRPQIIGEAFDKFLQAKKSNRARQLDIVAQVCLAFPNTLAIGSNAVQVHEKCTVGAQGYSSLSCGFACASVIGAIIGTVGFSMSVWQLAKNFSDYDKQKRLANAELSMKLPKHTPNMTADATRLVDMFANLPATEQSTLRKRLEDDLLVEANNISFPPGPSGRQ